MKLEDVKVVKQVTDITEVNEMLMNGWIIVKLFHQMDEDQSSKPLYIMGKMKV